MGDPGKPHVLRVIDGPEKGREFQLEDAGKLVIGRGSASDTQINDPRVSRVHCEIELRDGVATLTAAESAGKTMFRGKAIEQSRITPGESFRIGDTTLRLDGGDSPLDQSTMTGTSALDNLVGKTFAHYRTDKLIARGRTGLVFEATDTEKDRKAAVKILLPRVSSTDEHRDRFVRAMKTMLPLKHPNIVRLYHAGKQGKFCWVAMEYVEGEGMNDIIERLGVRDMLDWRKVWEVAMDIGRALKYAGDNNIIHRNLAPANILCRKSDGVYLLSDLMLAKATEGTQSFDVTAPGQLVGDIAYMSPERTEDSQVDARSDIYELGATLYALLTGRPPFEAKSQVDHIDKIRNEKPANPRTFQLSINEMFEGIVMSMLEKRPRDRPEDASQLLLDLERVGKFNNLSRD